MHGIEVENGTPFVPIVGPSENMELSTVQDRRSFRLPVMFPALFLLAGLAQAGTKDFAFISELLGNGFEIIETSYQSNIEREAIYLRRAEEYWVCLVQFQVEDFGDTKAPYAGGGGCFPLAGARAE